MQEDRHARAKRAEGRVDEGGWKPGVGQLFALALSGILLIAAVILGLTTGVGLLFAVPLGILALVLALVTFRGTMRKAAGACPHCGTRINFPSHMAEFNCPSCGQRIEVRDRVG